MERKHVSMLRELGIVGGIELNEFEHERRWERNELSERFLHKAQKMRLINHDYDWKVHDTIFELVRKVFQFTYTMKFQFSD